MTTNTTPWRGVALAATLVSFGCVEVAQDAPRHPLAGTVTRNGQPVREGGLIFVRKGGGGPVVNAAVEKDGTFSARSEYRDRAGKLEFRPGAPAGEYTAVYHPPSSGAKTGLEVELTDPVVVSDGGVTVALILPETMPQGGGAPRDEDRATHK
ncbi:hypothetical protein J0H58_14315 [bacterium]|nr:hypothetical protein [bacterium]